MEPELTIGVAFTPREWRAALHRHVRDHVKGVALRVVRDGRMALEEHFDVLVIDDEAPFLSPMLLASLRERAIPVIGLYDPDDVEGASEGLLERLGVETLLPVDVESDELVDAVRAAASSHDFLAPRFEEVIAGLDLGDGAEETPRGGRIVAVGGPAGAGATEIAVAVAQVLGGRLRTILVDIDEVAPGVARRLQRALYPHLLTALDGLRGAGLDETPLDGDFIDASLARPLDSAPDLPFDVLAGMADPRDWPLVRAEDVEALLGLLARRWPLVTINLGPHLEDLSRFVDRYGPSRAALMGSGQVVGVCEASPRGVLRFLDWLVEASPLIGERPVDVVVNRAPRGGFGQAEVAEALFEHAGPRIASLSFVPEDRHVAKAAWDGRLVPQSRFLRAVAGVTAHLDGTGVPEAVTR